MCTSLEGKSSSQNGDDNIYGRSQTMKSTVKSLIIKCGCLTRETALPFFFFQLLVVGSGFLFISLHRFFPILLLIAHRTQEKNTSVFFAIDSIEVVRRLNAKIQKLITFLTFRTKCIEIMGFFPIFFFHLPNNSSNVWRAVSKIQLNTFFFLFLRSNNVWSLERKTNSAQPERKKNVKRTELLWADECRIQSSNEIELWVL